MKKLIALTVLLSAMAGAGTLKVATYPVRHPVKTVKVATYPVRHPVKSAKKVIW